MTDPQAPESLVAAMLDWYGRRSNDSKLTAAARLMELAVELTLDNPDTRTRDIGGALDTDAFTAAVIGNLHDKD